MANGCSKRAICPKQLLQDVKAFIQCWVFTKKSVTHCNCFLTVIFFSVMGKEIAGIFFHGLSSPTLTLSCTLKKKKEMLNIPQTSRWGKEDLSKHFSGWFGNFGGKQPCNIFVDSGSVWNYKAKIYDLTFAASDSCGSDGSWWSPVFSWSLTYAGRVLSLSARAGNYS